MNFQGRQFESASVQVVEEVPQDAGPHVDSISYSCVSGGITGQVVVSNDGDSEWSGTINFFLTEHFPGGSSWTPTGDDDDVVFTNVPVGGTQTQSYSMGWNPSPGANSTRVENDLDTTKSASFMCEDPSTSTPTNSPAPPTSTNTNTPTSTSTSTDTPVPSTNTPTNTATATNTGTLQPTDTGTPEDPTATSTGTLNPSDTPSVTSTGAVDPTDTGTPPSETTGTPASDTDTPEPEGNPSPTSTQSAPATGGFGPGGSSDGVFFLIGGAVLFLVGGALEYQNRRFLVNR